MGDGAAVRVIVAVEDRPRTALLTEALGVRGEGAPVDESGGGWSEDARAAVLVASTSAARSTAVDDQITKWSDGHSAATVLVLLIDGELVWDEEADAFDTGATTALSTAAQRCFVSRPLWLEARSGVTSHVVDRVAAALSSSEAEAPRSAPAQPDRRRRRRALTIGVTAAMAVLVALVIGFVVGDDPAAPPTPTTSGAVPGPPASSDSSTLWWLLLPLGLVVGLVAGVWLTTRRLRRPSRPRSSAAVQTARQVAESSAPTSPARPGVFISHHVEADHELARRMAQDLRDDIDVWIAPESIAPGESWVLSIDRGLRGCRLFLALLSEAALSSPWVLREVQAAMELEAQRELRLVPVLVDECDVPILLRTYQMLRLASGYPNVIEQTRRIVATLT